MNDVATARNPIVERLIGDTGEPDHIIKAARALGLRALPAIRQSLNEQVSYPIEIEVESVALQTSKTTHWSSRRPRPLRMR